MKVSLTPGIAETTYCIIFSIKAFSNEVFNENSLHQCILMDIQIYTYFLCYVFNIVYKCTTFNCFNTVLTGIPTKSTKMKKFEDIICTLSFFYIFISFSI